jgi:hypothetical protein
MSDIQTPYQGTEQEPVISQVDQAAEPAAPSAVTPGEEVETPLQEPAPEAPSPEQPVTPDYKQKFVDSQREAILLAERERLANTRINQLTNTDTPTDEAMRVLYPEWDQLDDYNKRVLIRQEAAAMQTTAVLAKQQEIEARQKLEDQLDDVIDNSEFAPKLKDKETEFKKFARNPKNRGIAAETLAKAFLFDVEELPTPTPMTEALPAGSGGPRGDLTPKKMSLEEAAQLRKTDWKKYKELLDAGAIEDL